MTAPKRKKNYLNNPDMIAELRKCHAQDRLTEEMGKMLMTLVKRYATIPRFANYSYNEDMQSLALLTLCKAWKRFNIEKYDNPFAYYTQITHHAFHQLDNSERKQRDIRDALLVDQGKNPSFNYAERQSSDDDSYDAYGDSDYMEVHDKDVKFSKEIDEIVEEIQELQVKSMEGQTPAGEDNANTEEV